MSGIILLYWSSGLCFLIFLVRLRCLRHLCSTSYVSVRPHSVGHIHRCRMRCRCMNVFSCGRIFMCACLCLSTCIRIKKSSLKFLRSRGRDLQSSSHPTLCSEQLWSGQIAQGCSCILNISEDGDFIQLPRCLFQYLTSFTLPKKKPKAKRKSFSYQNFPCSGLWPFSLILLLCNSWEESGVGKGVGWG